MHNCVSDRWYTLGDLDDWNNLDHQLCDTPLDPAGWYPELGNWHLRTMSVQGYPAESTVGIMRQLDAMNLDYRWSTRWMGMEKFVQQQFLKKTEARWVNQEKSVFDRSMENFTGHQTRVVDPDATNKALDVNAARQEIGMDLTAYGLFTSTVTVWDDDPLRVDTKLTAVMQAFANAGFTIRAEDEHLVAAWLSSHPGNRVDNVRKTPQSALTLAHLAPGLNATWPGATGMSTSRPGHGSMRRRMAPISFASSTISAIWGTFCCSATPAVARVRWAISCGPCGCSTGVPRPRCLMSMGMPACSPICWGAIGMTWGVPRCGCNPSARR